MRLTLVDAEHAHDEDGELWIRDPVRWRRNDDPEPAEDAARVLLKGAFGWRPVDERFDTLTLTWNPWGAPGLEINGRRWRGAWSVLCDTPSGRRYQQMSA